MHPHSTAEIDYRRWESEHFGEYSAKNPEWALTQVSQVLKSLLNNGIVRL
jgi:hypothetical protein